MELFFEEHYSSLQCNIFCREERGSGFVMIGYDGQDLIQQPFMDGHFPGNVKPLLSIPLFMKDALIKAFIQEGAKQNLRTENENLLKGKLSATEKHLEDMREISKKLLDSVLVIKA